MSSTETDPQVDLLERIATPSRIGQSLGRDIWGVDYIPYPFVLEMEDLVLSAVMSEGDEFVMINLPPQLGKTSWSGVLLPFWFIGMFPDKQVIFITYSDDYSRIYGRMVRDLFVKYGKELFGLEVDPNNDSTGDWKLKGHPAGGMLSVGIGSLITGRSGHLVIIDDVLKNMEEASSVTMKRKHLRDFDGTILTRRQPGCTYVITATRFADDDLSGALWDRTQKAGYSGDPWKRLTLSAICEPPEDYGGDPDEYRDMLGRRPGEALDCRFSRPTDEVGKTHFDNIRNTIDGFIWACLYQQNPSLSEGGMFPKDKWKYAPRAEWPELYSRVRTWDIAATAGGGDWTVGALLGVAADGDVYVLGRFREQRDAESVIAEMKQIAADDGPGVPIRIERERSGAAKLNIEFFKKALQGYDVDGVLAEGTKEQRAFTYSTLQKGGHVWLPSDDDDAEWVKTWVNEHKGMMGDGRRPRHDDQIDCGAYAVNYLTQHGVVSIVDPNDTEANLADMLRFEEMYGLTS